MFYFKKYFIEYHINVLYFNKNSDTISIYKGNNKKEEQKSHNKENIDEATFSLPVYRDYFLLQNSDQVCIKFKVSLNKVDKNMQVEI